MEDGAVNRKLVKIMLEEAGAQVTTAENGWVGLQLATKKPFDLILMDMQMPVMDGYAAATRLREHGLTTPIVALTAHAMKGDEKKCTDAGCTAYLTKPIHAELLLKTVGKLLQMGQAPDPVSSPSDNQAGPITSTLPMDKPIYREVVAEFVEFLQDTVNAMRSASQTQSFQELASLAHALKGAGGTAGFDVLTEPASLLEQHAKQERLSEAESALEELAELSQRVTAEPTSAAACDSPTA